MPARLADTSAGRPSPDEPIETKIEQAVEDVNQEGQDALGELGELDIPEKIDQAEHTLKQIERTSHEIRKRAHDRTSDRFDDLNGLAIAQSGEAARAELRDVGEANTPEKQARADGIGARHAERKAQLEERWEHQKQRLVQRWDDQGLPKADFQLPNGRSPEFAAAYGLRLRSEDLTDGQSDAVIADL